MPDPILYHTEKICGVLRAYPDNDLARELVALTPNTTTLSPRALVFARLVGLEVRELEEKTSPRFAAFRQRTPFQVRDKPPFLYSPTTLGALRGEYRHYHRAEETHDPETQEVWERHPKKGLRCPRRDDGATPTWVADPLDDVLPSSVPSPSVLVSYSLETIPENEKQVREALAARDAAKRARPGNPKP